MVESMADLREHPPIPADPPAEREEPLARLEQYRTAARRILAEHRHIEGTTVSRRWRAVDEEMAEAVDELVALANEEFPLEPLPPLG